jgi:YD repeat-containing protein
LTDTTDADGRRTTVSYNADGDQTGETWVSASPAEAITLTYDADYELTGHLTRRNLAALATERGDRQEAKAQWRAVLDECPGDREALKHLGWPTD